MKNLDNKNQFGFTLVELAISTIIVGILIGAVLVPFSVWLKDREVEKTAENVEQVTWGVSAFHVANGYYPCPAPIDAARDNVNYGRAGECFDTSVAEGNCSAAGGRYCVAAGRSVSVTDPVDSSIIQTLPNTRVRIGTIPFRDLNMPEEFAYDSYGNRILYAVTETLAYDLDESVSPAIENIYNQSDLGGIEVLNDNGESHLDIPSSANFVVLSHGADGVGGYNRFGVSNGDPCNEGTANETLDSQNCDHLDGTDINATFYVSELAETGGANQHDDIVRFQVPLNAPLWARSSFAPADIYSISSADNPKGRVAGDYRHNFYSQPKLVGTDLDGDGEDDLDGLQITRVYENSKLWVGGNIVVNDLNVATTEQVQSNNICDRNGENCFPASAIGGATGTACPPGTRFMAGVTKQTNGTDIIRDDQIVADCEPIVNFGCADGELVKGIVDGKINCVPKPCPAQTRSECGQNYSLNAAEHGTRQLVHLGQFECRSAQFVCQNGVWNGNFGGTCTCNAGVRTGFVGCPDGCTVIGSRIRTTTTTCSHRSCLVRSNTSGSCDCPNNGGGGPTTTPTPDPTLPTPDPTPPTPGGGPGVGNPPATGGTGAGR